MIETLKTPFLSIDQFQPISNQKRIELVNTIRSSTRIDIFTEKNIQFFSSGIGGQKVKKKLY